MAQTQNNEPKHVLLDSMQSFDFAFNSNLMKNILGITYELSKALWCKELDIVNVMTLIKLYKQQLQIMRDYEWDFLLNEVASFCTKHEIIVPNMNDKFAARGRPRQRSQGITSVHHYQVELFYTTIDM